MIGRAKLWLGGARPCACEATAFGRYSGLNGGVCGCSGRAFGFLRDLRGLSQRSSRFL